MDGDGSGVRTRDNGTYLAASQVASLTSEGIRGNRAPPIPKMVLVKMVASTYFITPLGCTMMYAGKID